MTKLKGAKKRRKWPNIIILCILAYVLCSFAHLGIALYQTNLQIKEYENKKAALLAKQAELKKQIQDLNTDKCIERIAREELGMIKRGEKVVMLAEPGEIKTYVPPEPGYEFRD
ncbi:MAG: hypothetical protein PWP31_596 [Clostridia bacterium]|nr:hypothetical protein [Clostridia bacterium]